MLKLPKFIGILFGNIPAIKTHLKHIKMTIPASS